MADPIRNVAANAADAAQPVSERTDNTDCTAINKDFFEHKGFGVLMEGFIWSEVLGLPLCKRKGRSIRR